MSDFANFLLLFCLLPTAILSEQAKEKIIVWNHPDFHISRIVTRTVWKHFDILL